MVKTVIFDTDGVIIKREMYFSKRFVEEYGVAYEKILPFFENEFQLCLVDKADLKTEIQKYFSSWNWKGTVDELLHYWFSHESKVDKRIIDLIDNLAKKGIKCYLDTNNEKYRTAYLLDKVGLRKHFIDAFSSARLGFKKPELEFWKEVHKHIGNISKDEVLVWDDDKEIADSAREYGFHSELYTDFESFQKKLNEYVS